MGQVGREGGSLEPRKLLWGSGLVAGEKPSLSNPKPSQAKVSCLASGRWAGKNLSVGRKVAVYARQGKIWMGTGKAEEGGRENVFQAR